MARYLHENPCDANLINHVQRSTQALIIQIFSANPWPDEHFDRLVGIKLRGQVQRAVHIPQAIQHHRLYCLADTHLTAIRTNNLVNLPDEVNLLANPGHYSQVVDLLRADFALVHQTMFLVGTAPALDYPIITPFSWRGAECRLIIAVRPWQQR